MRHGLILSLLQIGTKARRPQGNSRNRGRSQDGDHPEVGVEELEMQPFRFRYGLFLANISCTPDDTYRGDAGADKHRKYYGEVGCCRMGGAS